MYLLLYWVTIHTRARLHFLHNSNYIDYFAKFRSTTGLLKCVFLFPYTNLKPCPGLWSFPGISLHGL